jgi:nucleotide sugar dehydrogenase
MPINNSIRIGISGLGFVGNSMMDSFISNGLKLNKNLFCYDIYKNGGIGSFESLLLTDILFLALPTQYDHTKKEYNKEIIYDTCQLLQDSGYKGVVVIKSTVEPETSIQLSKDYNLSVVHNPEFLTARTAYEDFHNQKHIVLGKSDNCTDAQLDQVADFYSSLYPAAMVSKCNCTESESMKIFLNCFYSVKVQFFNELYLTCKKTGIDYDKVKDLMLKNNWINPMHTDVPGPDGQLSYGGLCFPKDTNALQKFMESKGAPCEVLKATIKERNSMREDNDNIIDKP